MMSTTITWPDDLDREFIFNFFIIS